MTKGNDDARDRAKGVRLVLLDVDGVLTDGRLLSYSDGSEGRAFFVRDGMAIRVGQEAGLLFGIISGRESPVVTRRANELHIGEVHQGVYNKVERFEEIGERLALPTEAVCFVGDDLIDVPLMRRVGFAAAPADAAPEAREAAHFVASRGGGRGAVREVVEFVLRSAGRWDDVVQRLFKS